MTQPTNTPNSTTPHQEHGKDVHPDHVGRDDHGNISDPDLNKSDARAASKGYNKFVLSKSLILILVLMPIAVAIVYFLAR